MTKFSSYFEKMTKISWQKKQLRMAKK